MATIACSEQDTPYCFNCYYSFIEQDGLLVYKSSFGTTHERVLKQNNKVAGTIIPEHIEVATIRGIQFTGMLLDDNMALSLKSSTSYHFKFPFAAAVPGKIYSIELHTIKFTDNTKGFGYKNHWRKPSDKQAL